MPKLFTLSQITSIFAILVILETQIQAQIEPKPLNVVLFLVDDLGWGDLGCYGEEWIETPRIDEFAEGGVKFTDFYANAPVCSPTRAALQSGLYQTRFELTSHIPGHWRPFEKLTEPPNAMHLPEKVLTIGQVAQKEGYRTGYFGKWHLGNKEEHQPENRGYDDVIRTGGSHFYPGFRTVPKQDIEPGTYLTDYLTDKTIDFIRANKEDRFFVTLAHYAVHIPLQAKKELIEKYENKPKPEGDVTHPVYAAMVEHVDESFGRILDVLNELQLAGDTVVIFTSDNGGLHTRYDGQGHIVTTNDPLRDEKGSTYEGGIRVPTLIRWPGGSVSGSEISEPCITLDLFPTMLEAFNSEYRGEDLDGFSLGDILRNTDSSFPRQGIYWHFPHYHHSRPSSVVRSGDFKLIHFLDDNSFELYDLANDIGETNNLADIEVALVNVLTEQLNSWRKRTGALRPYFNERYNPQRAHEWWNKMNLTPIDLEGTYERIRALPFDGPPQPARPKPAPEKSGDKAP